MTERFKRWLGRVVPRLFKFETNYCDVDDNDELFIRFTDACPNKCKFCFDAGCRKLEHEKSGAELAREVLEKHASRKHLMISGGEPLLDPGRLLEFLNALPEDYVVESLMTSLPEAAFKEKDKLAEILKRCKILDISTHGNSNEEDEETYGRKFNGYDKQKFIQELASQWPDKTYVSCVLQESKFKTLYEVKGRIRHYLGELGVKNFYFNEVGNSEPFVKASDYISIEELFSRSHEEFPAKKSAFCYGCKLDMTKVFKQWFPDVAVVKCRRRCYRCGAGEESLGWLDVLKQFIQTRCLPRREATPVLHGDGKTTAWFTDYEI